MKMRRRVSPLSSEQQLKAQDTSSGRGERVGKTEGKNLGVTCITNLLLKFQHVSIFRGDSRENLKHYYLEQEN